MQNSPQKPKKRVDAKNEKTGKMGFFPDSQDKPGRRLIGCWIIMGLLLLGALLSMCIFLLGGC